MSSNRNERGWEDRTFPVVFNLGALGFLGIAAYLVITQKEGTISALVAAGLCIIAYRAKDFTSFDLGVGGLKAQMKSTIEEAQGTLTELKVLAEGWAKIAAEQCYGGGRWGSFSRTERQEAVDEMKATLKKVGITGTADIDGIVYRYDHFDYASDILGAASKSDNARYNEVVAAYHQKYRGIGNEAPPDELEKLLEQNGLMTDAARDLVNDYRHFQKERKHRRPEVWFKD